MRASDQEDACLAQHGTARSADDRVRSERVLLAILLSDETYSQLTVQDVFHIFSALPLDERVLSLLRKLPPPHLEGCTESEEGIRLVSRHSIVGELGTGDMPFSEQRVLRSGLKYKIRFECRIPFLTQHVAPSAQPVVQSSHSGSCSEPVRFRLLSGYAESLLTIQVLNASFLHLPFTEQTLDFTCLQDAFQKTTAFVTHPYVHRLAQQRTITIKGILARKLLSLPGLVHRCPQAAQRILLDASVVKSGSSLLLPSVCQRSQ